MFFSLTFLKDLAILGCREELPKVSLTLGMSGKLTVIVNTVQVPASHHYGGGGGGGGIY